MRILKALLFIHLAFVTAMSQEGKKQIEFIQVMEPLTQNTVTAILQDHNGFLWIGTRNGLNKYNGHTVIKYESSLEKNRGIAGKITSIYEDHTNTLWVGTTESGLCKYNPDTDDFISYTSELESPISISNNFVTSIWEDHLGVLWVGTSYGLNLITKDRTSCTRIYRNSDDPFSIPSNDINGVIEDHKGNMWVSTPSEGLSTYNRDTRRFIGYRNDPANHLSLISDEVRSLSKSDDGSLWVGTTKGLSRLRYDDKGTFLFEKVEFDDRFENSSYPSVLSTLVDKENRLWIGTEIGGLIIKDLNTGHEVKYNHDAKYKNSLPGLSIWSIYEDDRGFIWLGVFNKGLVKVEEQSKKFNKITHNVFSERSIGEGTVTSLAEIGDEIWVGTDGGGVAHGSIENNKFSRIPDMNDPEIGYAGVLCMLKDSEENLWVGLWEEGIRILRKGSKDFEKLPYDNSLYHDGSIFFMYEDRKGRIWIAAHRNGLLMLDPKSGITRQFLYEMNDPLSLSNNEVTTILEDSDNNLWIGTWGGGLNKVMENEGKFYFERFSMSFSDPRSISSNRVICLMESSDKELWIGTSNKLNKYNPASDDFTVYGKEEGLANETINAILEDSNKSLWISTLKGLTKFDIATNTFKHYSVLDGLQSNEFYKESKLKLKSGKMLFGGIEGFNFFDPVSIKDDSYQPRIYLSSFNLLNRDSKSSKDSIRRTNLFDTQDIDLHHDQNNFSFEFSTLSFSQTENNEYAYRLVGHDQDWLYVGNQRVAYYANIPPGEYTFEVKGTNRDGIWSNITASINVTVHPAWYLSDWAYVIYAIVFVSIIFFGIQTFINRERLKTKYKVEHLELAKMQELGEMKSRFFANISHEFRSPLTLLLGPLRTMRDEASTEEESQLFNMMIRNAESLLSLINQLLELSKLESGKMKLEANESDMVEFLKPILKSFSALANKKYISYNIDLPVDPVLVYFDDEKLEKIVINLLSNAFKYTPEFGKVRFKMTFDTKSAFIEVSDTGIGIPREEAKYIFNRYYRINEKKETSRNKGTGIGLSLTQELVQLHKGKIKLLDDNTKGATFQVQLPLGNDHLNPDQIIGDSADRTVELDEFYEDAMELESNRVMENIDRIEEEVNQLPLILAIEDSSDIRLYLKKLLEKDYRVLLAANGEEGIKMANNEIPDLVICDVMMPGIDGFEVCKRLKKDVKTSHIPVILLTAKASNESALSGFEHGADYYVTKPFNPKLLIARAKNILNTRDQIRDQLLNKNTLNIEPKDVKIPTGDQDFIDRAVHIVEKNISNSDFFVDDLCRELGLSRMQLYRKLKALIGKSANEFIRFVRLKRAAQLLDQGTLTISEITYEVGFNDLKYFRDCFKKQYGINPSEYMDNSSKTLS